MKSFFEWEMGLHGKVEEVNETLLRNIYTAQDELYRMSKYVIEAGGKRFRPLLTILAYEISTSEPYSNILDLAAGYELIHTASLIHDDIIDNATVRRGLPTLNHVDGESNAIVVGDYLFAKAYELGSRYGPTVSKIMADASSNLAEGQILEATNLGNLDLQEDIYLEIISNKTAKFFGACAEGATTAAKAPYEVRINLTNFAYNLGMAFQVTDDIMDIVGDQEKMGKPVLADIGHEAITLPAIYALKHGDRDAKETLRAALTGDNTISGDKIKTVFMETGSIDYSFRKAKSFTEKALESLGKTKKSADLDLLMELALIVIDRIEEFG
ncbi:MAG TPA: polyprenyl synthetase family protein [Thermoplasmataceae archaeon]|nr:polyprenyl synthetase family protein [Thermoplasmataceae archaeon]